jgi:hypothetical protein
LLVDKVNTGLRTKKNPAGRAGKRARRLLVELLRRLEVFAQIVLLALPCVAAFRRSARGSHERHRL